MKLHKLPNGEWSDLDGITEIDVMPAGGSYAIMVRRFGRIDHYATRPTKDEARALADEIAAIVNAAHERIGDRLLPALFSANCSTGEVSRVPPHQQRIYEEKGELDAKLRGLTSFIESHPIFPGLSSDERARMMDQQNIMARYSAILSERIAAF